MKECWPGKQVITAAGYVTPFPLEARTFIALQEKRTFSNPCDRLKWVKEVSNACELGFSFWRGRREKGERREKGRGRREREGREKGEKRERKEKREEGGEKGRERKLTVHYPDTKISRFQVTLYFNQSDYSTRVTYRFKSSTSSTCMGYIQ